MLLALFQRTEDEGVIENNYHLHDILPGLYTLVSFRMDALPVNTVTTGHSISVADMRKDEYAVVTSVVNLGTAEDAVIRTRLLELGFVAGECVRVVAEAFPGRDPLAVRLGTSTFALRRYEASMVQVTMHDPVSRI